MLFKAIQLYSKERSKVMVTRQFSNETWVSCIRKTHGAFASRLRGEIGVYRANFQRSSLTRIVGKP